MGKKTKRLSIIWGSLAMMVAIFALLGRAFWWISYGVVTANQIETLWTNDWINTKEHQQIKDSVTSLDKKIEGIDTKVTDTQKTVDIILQHRLNQ